MYLYFFERIVRAQVIVNSGPDTWALPHWDYGGGGTHNTLPLAFRDPIRADGSPNPLYVAQRNPGVHSGAGLPSSITSPTFALGRQRFTGASEFGCGRTSPLGQFWSQTGRLEQTPHNDVHVAIGGLMGDPDTAAGDPIFWLHHANIDRLWWLWQQQHGNATDAAWKGQSFGFMDAGGVAAALTAAGVLDTAGQLAYKYEVPPTQIPSPSVRKTMPPVKWPWPWPETQRLASAPHGPGTGPEPLRQLVGATQQPIRLVGEAVRATVAIDERAAQSLQADSRAAEQQGRAFLDIEDIEAERNPGTVYGVYVNLPDQPTAEDVAAHHVGNISLFGIERARNPRGDEHAHGLRVSMEITQLLDRLAADGTWQQGTQLHVTFRPLTLEAPAQRADLAAAIARTAPPDVPLTIGRVSVHFA